MGRLFSRRAVAALTLFGASCGTSLRGPPSERPSPPLDAILASKRDLWGEEATRRPGGPSYEFFAGLLPPLRYVNAEFRHYPIVLGAPGAARKARLVGNGSAVNARAHLRTWREVGFPVTFRVGERRALFGEDLGCLEGPRYAAGYLPIVLTSYREHGATYAEEVFAPVDPVFADHAAVFVRFTLAAGEKGRVAAHIGVEDAPRREEGRLLTPQKRTLILFDGPWVWEPFERRLVAAITPDRPAALAIFSDPLEAGAEPGPLTPAVYDAQKKTCVDTWQGLLHRGTAIEVPEPIVNDAWRASVLGCYLLLKGDQLCYSAGNQYERQYEAEGGDAVRTLTLYGHGVDAARMIVPLLEYSRKGLLFHQAGFKLQMLAHYYWVTRDATFVRTHRPRWSGEVEKIVREREPATGLLPREQYAGDIARPVYTLSTNANAWRGLRDVGAVLVDLGEREEGERILRAAAEFRQAILAAAEKSLRRDVTPPFLPQALFGEETPPESLTVTHEAGYWDLMAPYTLGSGVFKTGSEFETALLRTFQERGGLCMGMVRVHMLDHLYADPQGVDDLYGLRYTLALLERDEPDRALVGFYGKLAQGMTRDTYIGGEGSGLAPLDELGRPMYLPPNSAANAFFLRTLRDLLVQDLDLDDDGAPETLRLLFATPRRWLEDGKRIRVERAPTAFGEVSFRVESRLSRGDVTVEVQAPERAPKRTLLRVRLPEGKKAVSAETGGERLRVDEHGTVDVSHLRGTFTLRFAVP